MSVDPVEVLLVEGDGTLERHLAEALRKEGVQVRVAHTADEALSGIGTREPPVVVAEIGLEGGLSGFELSRRLRELDPHAQVILLTGSDDPRMTVVALRAGASDVVVKRFEGVPQLLACIHGAEARRRSARRHARAVRDLVGLGDDLAAELKTLSAEAAAVGLPKVLAQTSGATRVLVVDDELATAKALSAVLSSAGYEVELADSAEEARPLLESGRFHMLVTDKNLPGDTGLTLIREVTSRGLCYATALMTGYGSMSSAMEAVDAGADGYFLKPFEDVDLVVRKLDALREVHAQKQKRERALDAFRQRAGAFVEDFSTIRADLVPRAGTNGKSAK